jgi:IS1 family transposase
VACDPEHRLVVAVVPGARDVEGAEALVGEFQRRTGGRAMKLMTSDAYPAYETAILDAYGETVTPPRTGKPGRPKGPYKAPPADLVYATVEKRRAKGRVVEIVTRAVFGTMAAVAAALKGSRVSRSINTSLLERQHLTDRHHNARKSRKTYRFSKKLFQNPELSRSSCSIRLAQIRLDFRTFTGVVEAEKRADHRVRSGYPDGCSSTPGSRTARRSARWVSLSPVSSPW